MSRPTIESFKKKALKDPKVKAEYDALSPIYETKRKMIALRKKAGVTQEEMAALLNTKKTAISRLDSINATSSPTLSTLEDYASALGYSVKVKFERHI